MMGIGSKESLKKVLKITRATSSEESFSSLLLRHLLMRFAEYRMEFPIKEVMVFPNGDAYYVCPRCDMTLEREFMSYCDRCGQHLGWRGYRKAKVIYPANTKEILS